MSKLAKYFSSLGNLTNERPENRQVEGYNPETITLGELGTFTLFEYRRICSNLVYLFKQENMMVKDIVAEYNISLYQYQIIYNGRVTDAAISAIVSIVKKLKKFTIDDLVNKVFQIEFAGKNRTPNKPNTFTKANLHENATGVKLIYNRIIKLMIKYKTPYMGKGSLAEHLGYSIDSRYIYFVLIAKSNQTYRLSVDHLISIAKYYNVSITELVEGCDESI